MYRDPLAGVFLEFKTFPAYVWSHAAGAISFDDSGQMKLQDKRDCSHCRMFALSTPCRP